jgi:hypothetical protein
MRSKTASTNKEQADAARQVRRVLRDMPMDLLALHAASADETDYAAIARSWWHCNSVFLDKLIGTVEGGGDGTDQTVALTMRLGLYLRGIMTAESADDPQEDPSDPGTAILLVDFSDAHRGKLIDAMVSEGIAYDEAKADGVLNGLRNIGGDYIIRVVAQSDTELAALPLYKKLQDAGGVVVLAEGTGAETGAEYAVVMGEFDQRKKSELQAAMEKYMDPSDAQTYLSGIEKGSEQLVRSSQPWVDAFALYTDVRANGGSAMLVRATPDEVSDQRANFALLLVAFDEARKTELENAVSKFNEFNGTDACATLDDVGVEVPILTNTAFNDARSACGRVQDAGGVVVVALQERATYTVSSDNSSTIMRNLHWPDARQLHDQLRTTGTHAVVTRGRPVSR